MDEVKLLPCEDTVLVELRNIDLKRPSSSFSNDGWYLVELPRSAIFTRAAIEATRPPIGTDEVVERVGRAISTAANDEISSVTCEIYARSAIAAMPAIDQDGGELRGKRPRIPTPEMIAAAWAVIEASKKATGIAKLGPGLGVREIWQAMYDAASETPTPGPTIDQDGGEA